MEEPVLSFHWKPLSNASVVYIIHLLTRLMTLQNRRGILMYQGGFSFFFCRSISWLYWQDTDWLHVEENIQYKIQKKLVPSPPTTPPLPTHPQILIIVIWSEQGSEPEVRVTKDEGEGGCEHWVRGCHNNAVVMLWVVSQLWVRGRGWGTLQPDDSQLREELPPPSLAPRAWPVTQNKAHAWPICFLVCFSRILWNHANRECLKNKFLL